MVLLHFIVSMNDCFSDIHYIYQLKYEYLENLLFIKKSPYLSFMSIKTMDYLTVHCK